MFIRKLEIFGFKSFKNKTVLEFKNREITGIVGPNGCGKSNLADALLWVMGESSPKHLRGESLSDVIFGGTAEEPRGNLAEVSLTLSRGETGFPEGYKGFSELTVTRRAYRDEKSECFINQQACLLRDIRELFMNTGAGCRGFSLIEQEAIEKMITAKPAERRFIIEEAAGITKFKHRKSESARKLDLTQRNLQRLDDVLRLQESQLSQLSRQAKQAEKYRSLKREIENRKKLIERQEQENIFRAFQSLEGEMGLLQKKRRAKEEEIQKSRSKMESLGLSLKEIEKRIEEKRAGAEALRKEFALQQMEEAVLLDKAKALEKIESLKKESRDQWREREARVSKIIESLKAQKTALMEKEKAIQKEMEKALGFFKSCPEAEDLEQEAGQIKKSLGEIRQNKKSEEISLAGLERQLEFIEKEIEALLEEKAGIQYKIQQSIREKDHRAALLKKRGRESQAIGQSLEGLAEREKSLESLRASLKSEIAGLNQNILSMRRGAEEMEKLIKRFETANEGAEDLAKWRPEEFQPLFQSLEADADCARALGSVLGHYAQALISKEGLPGIERAVQRLKESQKGRACFLSSLPGLKASEPLRGEIRACPGFVCFLDEKIKGNFYADRLKPFLGQTAVVSNLSAAFEFKRRFPDFQFATLEGDLVTRDSFVYAGSSNKETSLFQIRSQIEERSKELLKLETEIKIKRADLESCLSQLEPVYREKQALRYKASQSAEALAAMEREREFMERDLLKLSEDRIKSDQKIESFKKAGQDLLERKKAGRKEIQNLKKAEALKESRLGELSALLSEISAHKMRKAKWEEALRESERERERAEESAAVLQSLAGAEGPQPLTIGGGDPSRAELEEKLCLAGESKQKLSLRQAEMEKQLEGQNRLKADQEQNIKNLERSLFQIQLDMGRLKSEEDKKEMEQAYLRNKLLESYKINIEDYQPETEEIPLDRLKGELERFERQLEKIKELNFLALEEYEKLSKENFFLNQQKEDLVKSKKEILKVVSHIDRLCSSRFNDMLEEINKRFSRVFPIVFQGDKAKAELILREEPEGEEPGVDILVHPPGKRPQSVSLLSRGEKALTAICLIYSLFLVRPSPFCVIDEADAPLDDANIVRFLSILREMSRKSQIIAITHNKHTMRACAKLYGVTMERPGLSQIVSADMEKAPSALASP